MADNASTLGTITGQLAEALTPLTDRMTEDEILELLADLGFVFPPELVSQSGIGPALTNAAAAASALPALIDALSQAAGGDLDTLLGAIDDLIGAIGDLLNALDALVSAIKAVAANLPGVTSGDVIAFAEELVRNLLDYLIVVHLESFFPRLLAFLSFVGAVEIQSEQPATNPPQPPFTRRRVRFDRIGQLLKEPQAFMSEVYKWGDNDFDDELLLARLNTLLFSFGLPAHFKPRTSTQNPTLRLLLFSLQKKADLTPPGLQATLSFNLQDEFTITLPFPVEGWSIELAQQGRIDAGVSVAITPPGTIDLTHPVPTTQLNGKTSLAVIAQNPARPLNILALPRIGSVVSDQARAQIGITYTAGTGGAHGEPVLELKLVGARFASSLDNADGFSKELMPAEGLSVGGVDIGLGWSPSRGVFFTGGGLETTIPLNLALGPFTIDLIGIRARLDDGIALDVSLTGRATLGPVTATVEGIGFSSTLKPGRGRLGVFDLTENFLFPSGVGIAVTAGPVHGGGFLSFEPEIGRYSGAVELSIYDISVKAFGLIETKVPGVSFSFVIVISAEFTPIQLGFGFTLNGVGGLVGINRTVNSTELRKLVLEGRSENLLFPKNLIANAPTIIRDLGTVFPARQSHYVFGPLGKLGWGTPTLITGEIGVIIEIPGVVAILGEVKILLPKPDVPLVKMNMSVGGTLDFPNKTFSLDAALHDSIIEGYPISGQMALRVKWGEAPNFVASIGGFHPSYQPPKDFPKLQPMTLDLGQHGRASVTVTGFFAVTSNTVQVGGDARLHAEGSGISLDASVSVKALFVFSPFHFEATVDAGVKISFHGYGPSVHLHGVLEGPAPWHIRGELCVSIIFWDACLGFDETFGEGQPASVPEIDPWDPQTPDVVGLKAALQDAGNWSGVVPAGTASVVSRAQGSEALVDPVGGVSVHQKAVPVETDHPISRFGVAKVKSPVAYALVGATFGTQTTPPPPALKTLAPVSDFFAPAQFFQMDDGKKLSAPGFEEKQAGYVFAENDNNLRAGSNATVDSNYTTYIIAADGTISDPQFDTTPQGAVTGQNKRSAVAMGGVTQLGTRRFIDRLIDQAFDIRPPRFILSNNNTLAAIVDGQTPTSRTSALLSMDTYRLQNPAQRLQVQVSALHELA